MGAQCSSQNSLRRRLVAQQGLLNGIDFLEVLDSQAPAGSPRQQTLLVHLLLPGAALTAANFAIAGGVRVTNINCVWAYPAATVPVPPALAAEAAYFAGLEDANKIYVVRTSVYGDFSTYTLNIVAAGQSGGAPPNFDPRLCSVTFSFKVDCPSDFDCQTSPTCQPPVLPSPPIDYLAKDFASFTQLMLDRMAATVPAWQERNTADLGIAMVETLAYAADHLSYYQDAVATESYLGTARLRTSVRRHAVLLGYAMHTGCTARAWVFLELDPSITKMLVPGPGAITEGLGTPGTRLLTETTQNSGSIPTAQMNQAILQGSLVFETMSDIVAYSAHNIIRFYTWSDEECCLPAGATKATLSNDGLSPLQLSVGDALLFEEVLSPVTGVAADADPSHRCVVRLTSVTADLDPLNNTPLIDITWAAGDALTFPLCLSASIDSGGGSAVVNDLSVARGNMVLADYGVTVFGETLNPSLVPSTGLYQPQLQNTNVTFSTPYDDAAARQAAVAGITSQDPSSALPEIALVSGTDLWTPVLDLLESSAFDRDFVVETEDDGTATLRFGDGELGALPVSGMIANYRVGNGSAGNVGAESITNIPIAGFTAVRNPLSAQGGVDPETSDQVRQYAPQAFRVQQRAVTAADYATLAGAYPGVSQARATRRWTGSWYTMFVSVDLQGGQTPDATLESNVAAYLNPYRLTGYDIQVEPPVMAPLQIAFTVCVAPGYLQTAVEQALYLAFSNGVLPNGQNGFFNPDNFTFGQPVYLSRIVSVAMSVPGVQWVNTNDVSPRQTLFQRWGRAPAGELAAGEIVMAPLEIAQLDNNPNAPENGIIEFYMQGGL
jgi:Baseplate J-like protein